MKKQRWILLLPALLSSLPALSQSSDDVNSSLQFNFSNPGARSLGFGGAFTARADDATAVYANPAGLVQIFSPEVSIDVRSWSYKTRFLEGGTQLAPDSFDGLDFDRTDDPAEGLSFLSAIYPRGRWVFGFFRHELANFRSEVHSEGAMVFRGGGLILARPIDAFYDLGVENVGVSAAVRLGSGLSLGATLAVSQFDLASRTERLDDLRSEAEDELPPGQVLGEPHLCCEFGNPPAAVRLFHTQVTDPEEDDDLAWTLGLLWQSPANERAGEVSLISVAAVYRRGPEFGFRADSFTRFGRDLPDGKVSIFYVSDFQNDFAPEQCRQEAQPGCPGVFKVPDVTGLGISVRPTPSWIIALDYNRVEYSDLIDRMLDVTNADPSIPLGETGRPQDFEIDDADEFRLGVEHDIGVFPDLFVRAGAWYDPDHKLRYTGPVPGRRAVWVPGEDVVHYTAGIGLRWTRFQIDVGADLSDRIDTFSISAVLGIGSRVGRISGK